METFSYETVTFAYCHLVVSGFDITRHFETKMIRIIQYLRAMSTVIISTSKYFYVSKSWSYTSKNFLKQISSSNPERNKEPSDPFLMAVAGDTILGDQSLATRTALTTSQYQ